MAATVIPIVLNCKNYDDWSSRIMIYLLAKDLWDVIDQGHPKTEEESKVWKKKNAKALYAIQNSCGDDIYKLIKDIKRAKQAWDTLSNKLKPGEPSDEKPSDENPPDEKPPDEEVSVVEAYATPNDHDATRESAMEDGSLGGLNESDANDIHTSFDIYVKNHGWDNAINFLRHNRPLVNKRLQFVRGGTALHFAIQNFKNCGVRNVEELVEIMEKDDLEIQDEDGLTALYHLIRDNPDEVEVAKRMVQKKDKLVTILPPPDEVPLVVLAQWRTEAERTARYFYKCTPHRTLSVRYAAELVSNGFYYKKFDIAWDLIQRYPKLAIAKNYSQEFPLVALASNRSAFKSETEFSLLEKLIYCGICIKPLPSTEDGRRNVLSNKKENQRHLISGINHIYKKKLVHERVKQFLPLMCRSTTMVSDEIRKSLDAALCVAAERGHVEYIKHVLEVGDSTHHVLSVRNEKGQNLLQIAVECRHHKVYNNLISILRPSSEIQGAVQMLDYFDNNILHTVASITPLSQIDHIQGAALKMQRELQWYKEVEKIADSKDFKSVNKDYKTPRKVFTENHKELRKEAEKSMREIATSCTVVGTLIVTIMFAAAFTVPSGNGKNDEAASLPTFLTNKVFTTFIVSDAISLFSSTTSVIMFLGILTSRYSEDDFYKSLPTKMIVGLFALFLSIATMMIVFLCGLYIMLDGKSSIVIPSMLFATVPVISFIVMQFPLLLELSKSTFGRGIFHGN